MYNFRVILCVFVPFVMSRKRNIEEASSTDVNVTDTNVSSSSTERTVVVPSPKRRKLNCSESTIINSSKKDNNKNNTDQSLLNSDNEDEEKTTQKKNKTIEDQYRCSICTELLFEPTTTTCGHSFCKVCLLKWIIASFKNLNNAPS